MIDSYYGDLDEVGKGKMNVEDIDDDLEIYNDGETFSSWVSQNHLVQGVNLL